MANIYILAVVVQYRK